MLTVLGPSLAGCAAAARLARLGHRVTLVNGGAPLGTGSRPMDGETVTLPSAWRDLFKKSGAHLVTELNRAGLELVPAPPARRMLDDGTVLALPTARGEQWATVSAAFGEDEAARWRDLLDDLDDVWAAYRRHALEGIAPVTTPGHREALWLDRTLADVAERLTGPLAGVVLACGDTPEAPGILALPLAVERMFGRWRLLDCDGAPRPASRLVGLLADRLRERGVTLAEEGGHADLDCRPSGAARPRSADEWLAAPPIVGADGALRASASSPAGDEPWAELSSAALAVYALHERVTGEDCRPTNVDFRLPRLA